MELLQPDLHPPDTSLLSTLPPPLPASLPPSDPPHLDPPKRQRRPSVRLGEIGGDPPYDPHPRRHNRTTWRNPKFLNSAKTRPLTNLVNGAGGERETLNSQSLAEPSNSFADFGQRKPKYRKPTKKARTNWSKLDLPAVNEGGEMESSNNNDDDDFDEEQANSDDENMGLEYWDQQSRGNRHNGVVNSNENEEEEKRSEESVGVRDWLSGLGLGRYAPVFEIHEVDDEVLPLLTMEDLKDMGINAVGSRRKMYSAILKLRKGFS